MAQHQVQRYTTLLSLTPAQVEQATTFFTTEATARQNSRASEHTAHQALEAAIKANDTATIQSTATTLGQMEGEMLAAHAACPGPVLRHSHRRPEDQVWRVGTGAHDGWRTRPRTTDAIT